MTIARIRRALYLIARLLGDFQAVRRGRIGERIARRAAGGIAALIIGALFR